MLRALDRFLLSRPVVGNMIVSGLLGAAGDVLCQKVVEKKENLDIQRLVSITTFCTLYQGIFMPKIYESYSYLLPRILTSSNARFSCGATMMDNLGHSPLIYMPIFYLSVGSMQGHKVSESLENLRVDYPTAVLACWSVWVPLQLFNFAFVPPQLRVAFVNVGCLLWNVIIDFVHSRDNNTATKSPILMPTENTAS